MKPTVFERSGFTVFSDIKNKSENEAGSLLFKCQLMIPINSLYVAVLCLVCAFLYEIIIVELSLVGRQLELLGYVLALQHLIITNYIIEEKLLFWITTSTICQLAWLTAVPSGVMVGVIMPKK